jgi:hypothetical protein
VSAADDFTKHGERDETIAKPSGDVAERVIIEASTDAVP